MYFFNAQTKFAERFIFITGSFWHLDSNFTIGKCRLSNILRFWYFIVCFCFLFQGHFAFLAFYVGCFVINLFPAYFDHSIHNQPKTAEHRILCTLCNMKNVFSAFVTKHNDNNTFILNLQIFNIYLLCVKENYIKEPRINPYLTRLFL